MYAYDFIGKRYDVGNKLGFLQATIEYALKRDDLKDEFAAYLKDVTEKLKWLKQYCNNASYGT